MELCAERVASPTELGDFCAFRVHSPIVFSVTDSSQQLTRARDETTGRMSIQFGVVFKPTACMPVAKRGSFQTGTCSFHCRPRRRRHRLSFHFTSAPFAKHSRPEVGRSVGRSFENWRASAPVACKRQPSFIRRGTVQTVPAEVNKPLAT
jgi:hypothetical protein